MFRNVSVLMLCVCQQAEPILMSTTPNCRSQHRITPYTTCSANPFSPSDNPHKSVVLITTEWPQGQLQIDTRGTQWLALAPVTGAEPENHQLRGSWTCQHLIPASPAAQWLPKPQGTFSNPTLSWSLEAKTSCLFANFYCLSMFWKMWPGFLQPGFLCSRPIHLTFCKQFCFGGWMKCIYLAAEATWVATAKQRNYLCSQQGRRQPTVLF